MRKTNLFIEHDEPWVRNGTAYVRGEGFLNDNQLSTADLAELIDDISSYGELRESLKSLNGFWTIIKEFENQIAIACDHIRSWPLYYTVNSSSDIYISDHPDIVHCNGDLTGFDPLAVCEHLYTGYVSGENTLSRDVKQLLAGEIVTFSLNNSSAISKDRHFQFSPGATGSSPSIHELDSVVNNSIQRLIDYADGRTILLALSGGYDSRLIALGLDRLNYDNVITYTHDMPSGEQNDIPQAKQLADDLGFEHLTINITRNDFREMYQSGQLEKIINYVGFYDSVVDWQESLVLDRLNKNAKVPDDAVDVRGHKTAGVGSQITKQFLHRDTIRKKKFIYEIWWKNYNKWRPNIRIRNNNRIKRFLEEKILGVLPENIYQNKDLESVQTAVSGIGSWWFQERTSKYLLFNYEYDYFGFDRWYPLWDREYAMFWENVQYETLIRGELHKTYVNWLDQKIRGKKPNTATYHIEPKKIAHNTLRSITYKLPYGIQDIIKMLYDKRLNSYSSYGDDPRYGLITENEFNSIGIGYLHPESLPLILLYNKGYFDLDSGNIKRMLMCELN